MKKLTTTSGAVYLYDPKNQRLHREGPHSPGIDYNLTNDGEWHDVTVASFGVGQSAYFGLGGDRFRRTTPIVSIEDV